MDNLVLTGFMGTGKTSVGRKVARRLGRPFVDMDAEIEARAGKPISRIFEEDGEPVFRVLESEILPGVERSARARRRDRRRGARGSREPGGVG